MRVVFTYVPIRLKSITELYLRYSISNLNKDGIVPILFSDKDYLVDLNLDYEWREIKIPERYKNGSFWQYAKILSLSKIDFPFCHLDNDLVVKDFSKIKIHPNKLNLAYKHPVKIEDQEIMSEIFSFYTQQEISFNFLNNTCIISSSDWEKVNKANREVLQIFENNYDFFSKKYEGIPSTTLNQQFLNLYFSDINYLFEGNPEYHSIDKNGIAHIPDKILHKEIIEEIFGKMTLI